MFDADHQGTVTAASAAEPAGEDCLGSADATGDREEEALNDVIVSGIQDGLNLVPTAGTLRPESAMRPWSAAHAERTAAATRCARWAAV